MDLLWAMRVFVRVVECGSFTKAADSLDLANATVTSCVKRLEGHLKATLLQRNTRFVHLTDDGALFFRRAMGILHEVEATEAELRSNTGEVTGVIRVEAPLGIAATLICPRIPDLVRRYPGMSVAITLTNQPRSMIERGTDVAIRMDHVEDADLVAKPVYQSGYVVCGSPELLRRLKLPAAPRNLDPRQCLGLLNEGQYVARDWNFSDGEDKFSIRPQGSIAFNNSYALIGAALRGAGLVYILDVFVNEYIASGQLVDVYPGWITATRTFYAATPKTRFMPPKVRVFVDFLSEMLDEQRRLKLGGSPISVGRTRRRKA